MKKVVLAKNIKPIFLIPYTPQLNPVELCFNIIRNYVERTQPRTKEELRNTISKILGILNQKDFTPYFKHSIDYDLIEKNYWEKGVASGEESGQRLWIKE